MSATDFGDPHQIIHIPARDLTGSREAKLAELELFLAQLQVVRLALRGQVVRLEGFNDALSHQRAVPQGGGSWPARRLRNLLHAVRSSLARHAKGGRS